jgi:hypothetical protein
MNGQNESEILSEMRSVLKAEPLCNEKYKHGAGGSWLVYGFCTLAPRGLHKISLRLIMGRIN